MKREIETKGLSDKINMLGVKELVKQILKTSNIRYNELVYEEVKFYGNSYYLFFRIDSTAYLLKITEKNVFKEQGRMDMAKILVEYVLKKPIDILLERNITVASGKAIVFAQKQ